GPRSRWGRQPAQSREAVSHREAVHQAAKAAAHGEEARAGEEVVVAVRPVRVALMPRNLQSQKTRATKAADRSCPDHRPSPIRTSSSRLIRIWRRRKPRISRHLTNG